MKSPNTEDLKNKAFTLRGKFNSILEERLLDGNAESHHIMSIEVPAENFNFTGELTELGQKKFWAEIDKAIQRFDTGEITFKPRKFQPSSTNHKNSPKKFIRSAVQEGQQLQHDRLPTPPLRKIRERRSRSRSRSCRTTQEKLYKIQK